jgi:hypothetical protein
MPNQYGNALVPSPGGTPVPAGAASSGAPDLQRLQATLDANPWMLEAMRGLLPGGGGKTLRDPAVIQRLKDFQTQTGFKIPEGYTINAQSGKIEEDWGVGDYLKAGALTLAAPLAIGAAGALAGGGAAGGAAGAGGTSAGTTAGTVTASSAPSWLERVGNFLGSDLGRTAIGVGGNLLGTKMQADAAKDAAALNQKYLDDALAYEKERDAYARSTEANRYGAMMGRTDPYAQTGASANARMASLLGLSAPSASGPPPQTPMGPAAGAGGAGGGSPAAAPDTPMILMQAPDGTSKPIPAHEEAHWSKLGARRVG